MPEGTAIYSLGRKGVNLVDDPLILEDGSLTFGQNAQTSPNEADGGLLKRGGMGILNLPGSGPLLAILSLPFADPTPGTLITAGYPPWPIIPVAPVPGASTPTSSSLTLVWDPVIGATGYNVRVATDAGMTNIVSDQDVGDVTTTDVTGLDPDTQYYWDTQAYNARGDGPTSDPEPAKTRVETVTGTFTILASGASGWAGLDDIVKGIPATASCAAGSEVTGVIVYPQMIALDGGAAVDISTLPAGFAVTGAMLWHGGWQADNDVPGQNMGSFYISRNAGPLFSGVANALDPNVAPDDVITLTGPLTVAGLCASTVSVRAVGGSEVVPGGVAGVRIVLKSAWPEFYFDGTYEIS